MADQVALAALEKWVVEALKKNGGSAYLLDVARFLWDHHEKDIRQHENLVYTWQYDMRWAATSLRKKGRLSEGKKGVRAPWTLLD